MAHEPEKFLSAERAWWSTLGCEPTEHRVKLPAGNEVRVQEIGDGPPILFIHGVAVAGSSWGLLARALGDEYRCILIDRPGCGLSDPVPDGPLTTAVEFAHHAEDLAPAVLDALGLESAHIACSSMGGFFGFRAAIVHPHRVTKLVEYSWAMGTPMAKVPMMMRVGSLGPMKAITVRIPIGRTAVKAMLKQVGMRRAITTGTFDDDMVSWTVALLRHTDTFRSETANNTFVSLSGENPDFLFTDEELRRVTMPVLLLWGDEDTNGGAPEARRFARRLPAATLEIVEEAGHAPWIDAIDHCAEQTRRFLRD